MYSKTKTKIERFTVEPEKKVGLTVAQIRLDNGHQLATTAVVTEQVFLEGPVSIKATKYRPLKGRPTIRFRTHFMWCYGELKPGPVGCPPWYLRGHRSSCALQNQFRVPQIIHWSMNCFIHSSSWWNLQQSSCSCGGIWVGKRARWCAMKSSSHKVHVAYDCANAAAAAKISRAPWPIN